MGLNAATRTFEFAKNTILRHPRKAGHPPIRRLLSRGKTSLSTPLCIFLAEVCCMASRSRFAVSPAPVSSAVWYRSHDGDAPDTHQDQGLIWTPRHLARHPAPGAKRAPENPRYPALSNRDDHRSCGSPKRVHPTAGSRQRRREIFTSRSEAIWCRLRPGLISLAGCQPSRLPVSGLSPIASVV
jgi:hypothetical protein